MLRKINFNALKSAARDVGYLDLEAVEVVDGEAVIQAREGAATEAAASATEPVEILRRIHHCLFEIHLQEGQLVCPESGRQFTVKDGEPKR